MKRTRGSSYLVLLIDLNKLMDNEGYPLKGSLSYRIKLQKELRLNSFLLEFQYVQQLAYMIVKE